MQRFVWDLRYAPPPAERRAYPISAIYRDTPAEPLGPEVLPGQYTVRLTVSGKAYTQPITVKMDPRVTTPAEGLAQQFNLSMQAYDGIARAHAALAQIRQARAQLKSLGGQAKQGAMADAIAALDKKMAALAGSAPGFGRGGGDATLAGLMGAMTGLLETLQAADVTPTTQVAAAVNQSQQSLSGVLTRWEAMKNDDVKTLNEQLRQASLPVINVEPR
jgi:hypothetical protein